MRLHASRGRHLVAAGRAARGGEAGFTLLEICFAMVTMMIVGLGAASLFLFAINNNSAGATRAITMAVAQERLERLRNVPYNTLVAGVTRTEVINSGQGFEVRTAIVDANVIDGTPRRKVIEVRVRPQRRNQAWVGGWVTLQMQRSSPLKGPYRQA